MIKIAPSILSADFMRLAEDIRSLPEKDVDFLHLDVMDGHFVPNLTFGYPVVSGLPTISDIPLDVHLMVEEPERYIDSFAKLSPAYITFQAEATNHPERLLRQIRETGAGAGISLNPGTSWEFLRYIYEACDLVLVMSVNPGFGGQKFIAPCAEKIRQIRSFLDEKGSSALIQVDGGVNDRTASLVAEAGAGILVAGSFIFGSPDRAEAVRVLKNAANNGKKASL